MKGSLDEIIRCLENNEQQKTWIKTGIKWIDDFLGGLRKGTLTVIGARPAMGRTAFTINLIKNIIVENSEYKVSYYTLLHSLKYISNCFLSNVFHIDKMKIEKKELLEEDKRTLQVEKFWDWESKLNRIELFDGVDCRLEVILQHEGFQVIVIDTLQMLAFKEGNDLDRTIERILFSLKESAIKKNISVIVLSELNRGLLKRFEKEPELQDLTGCSAIEEIADLVMLVHRPEYYRIYQSERGHDFRNMAELIVAKNNQGPTCKFLLPYEASTSSYNDSDFAIMSFLK